MTAKSTKPILLTGCIHVRGKFVSKVLVQAALEATGSTVLYKPPKDDNDVQLIAGRTLGKKKKTQLRKAAEGRGFDIVDMDAIVTPRFNTALRKILRSSSKLLASERKLLEELDSKKKSA